jgi:hypothetical protein
VHVFSNPLKREPGLRALQLACAEAEGPAFYAIKVTLRVRGECAWQGHALRIDAPVSYAVVARQVCRGLRIMHLCDDSRCAVVQMVKVPVQVGGEGDEDGCGTCAHRDADTTLLWRRV